MRNLIRFPVERTANTERRSVLLPAAVELLRMQGAKTTLHSNDDDPNPRPREPGTAQRIAGQAPDSDLLQRILSSIRIEGPDMGKGV